MRAYTTPESTLTDMSVAELLVETRHLLNEFTVLMSRLPSPQEAVVVPRPLVNKLSDLEVVDLDLLQLVHNASRLQPVMDQWHETDVQTARRLLTLLDGGYFRRA